MKIIPVENTHNNASLFGRLAIVATLALAPSVASANTFIGDAYGARIQLNAATLIGVGATIVDNPNLPVSGSNVALTNGLLNVTANASATGTNVGAFTVLDSGTINTSTIGPNFFVDSFSQVEDADLFPGLSLSLPNPVPVLPDITLNLGSFSLVSADLIRSDTTANALGNSGVTSITNLTFGARLVGLNLQANSLGNLTILNDQRRTFYLGILGTVSEDPSQRPTAVAELIINDQIVTNNGNTRTTNALTVNVLRGNPLANGSVIVSSSTAGFVVPETGSVVYAGLAGSILLGTSVLRLRRNTKK